MSRNNDEFIVVCRCGSGFWVSESSTKIKVDLDNGEIVVSVVSEGDGDDVPNGIGGIGDCNGDVGVVEVKVSDDKVDGEGGGSGGVRVDIKSSSHDSSCMIVGMNDDLDPDWVFGSDSDYYPHAKTNVPCTCSTDETDPLWCCFWGRKSRDVIEISSDEEVSLHLKTPKKEMK